jgi:hypothetical protein
MPEKGRTEDLGGRLGFLHLRNVQGHPWTHKRVYHCPLSCLFNALPGQRVCPDLTVSEV